MRAVRSTLGFFLVALALVACRDQAGTVSDAPGTPPSPTPAAAFPVTLVDDAGVEVTIDAEPQRIVTFAPSATEILFELGLGDRIVGVSGPFDDYPAEAQEIEGVGGAGEFGADPNLEKVVSLEPDLFLAISGGDEWKERLRELGVPVFTLNASDLEDLLHDIATVGRLTGATEEAAALVARMEADAAALEEAVAGEPAVVCFFEVYFPPLMTVGPDTFIADLLRRAGCESVSEAAATDYPEWSVDDLVARGPEVYLVSSESGVSPEAVADRPGFGAISAVAEGNVVLVDSDLVSRPGPRIVEGLRLLAEALHPGVIEG